MSRRATVAAILLALVVVYLQVIVHMQGRRIEALERRLQTPTVAVGRAASTYPNGETREQYIDRQVRGILQDREDSAEVRRRVEAATR